MGKSKVIEKARAEYEYLTGDEELKRLEYLKDKALREEAASRRLGMEEGMEKRLIKGKRESAISMKRDGMNISMIIKYTGLSRKEIESL